MNFGEGADMQRNRLGYTLAVLVSTFAMSPAAAQAPTRPPAQPATQQPQPAQQPLSQGQPLLVVPAPQPAPPATPRIDPDLPTVEIAPLIQRVERASGKRFLLDSRLGARIYLGGVEPNDVTYPVMLAIFRANGFAAFESQGYVNVVPDANIRFHAPVLQTDDASIPPDLYVTRVLATVNVGTPQLVPILRPMMPQAAHLAAHADSNKLIVMDRYENVQRITEVVRSLDVPPPPGRQPPQ
jgi:type II secretory pathway component GspD/PulD (secretin)